MNEFLPSEPDPVLNETLLDRLVDGELSLEEQRQLLNQLEQEPSGWRELALRFVEVQTLRQSCREWVAPILTAIPRMDDSGTSGSKRRVQIAAAAVALLLAFGLGSAVGRQGTHPMVAEVIQQPSDSPSEAEADFIPPQRVEAVPVALQYTDGSFSPPVTTPVVDATSPLAQPWLNGAYRLPDRVREQLRRRGQKLSERQEWVEVDLADGRRGYLPVKEWTVSPVSMADFR